MTTAAIDRYLQVWVAATLLVAALGAARADDTAVDRDMARAAIIPQVLGHPYKTQMSPDLAAMVALMPPASTATGAAHLAPEDSLPVVETVGPASRSLGSILASMGAATHYSTIYQDPADRNIVVEWVPHGRMRLDTFLFALSCQSRRTLAFSPTDKVILVMPGAPHGC
jgi:hypothetical protein